MRLVVFLLLCLSSSLACAARELTTIQLNYAAPEQIVEALKPMLSTGSSISIYQNQLVLNATAEELATIRGLLQTLDVMGRQLLISLRSESTGSDTLRSIDIDGVIRSGDTVMRNHETGRHAQTRTSVRLADNRGASTGKGNQAVRATEGMPAYIATGLTAPVQRYAVAPDGRTYYQQEYLQAVSGFYATTWVNDGVVRVSIDQSNDNLSGRAISTQQLQSEVSGPLGEWISIGVISAAASEQNRGIASRAQSARSNSTQLFLKVDLL